MEQFKGFMTALLCTCAFLVLCYFICRDDVERAARPIYSPDGSCFYNCK